MRRRLPFIGSNIISSLGGNAKSTFSRSPNTPIHLAVVNAVLHLSMY